MVLTSKTGDMMYMKFDVVVCNTPYNNDQFRKDIVPKMKEITYIEKPTDVFSEATMCGD